LDNGERIVQETRLWDADRNYTRSMRSKEYAHDYRYFPEPDLVPLALGAEFVAASRGALPELPRVKRARFMDAYRLPAYDAAILTQGKALADYYEATAAEAGNAKAASNWIMSELLREIGSDDERAIAACRVTPAHLGQLVRLIDDGTISGKIGKD